MEPDKLLPGQLLAQTFRIPEGVVFDAASVRLPTWHSKTSGATLRLFRGETLLVERRLTNVVDNDWQELRPRSPQGAGRVPHRGLRPCRGYRLVAPLGRRLQGGPSPERRQAHPGSTGAASARREAGAGTIHFALEGPALVVETELRASAPLAAPHPKDALPWRWRTTWTKAGYDCTPRAGVVFGRFFSNNQRYMPAQQLKRRDHGGLHFDGCRWIEMEGTGTADLRIEGDRLHLHWEMTNDEMSLRFDMAQQTDSGGLLRSRWRLWALPREDSVPADFPRFDFPDTRLTEDANRFWWSAPSPIPVPRCPPPGSSGWPWCAAGMMAPPAKARCASESYPITAAGFVHTWRQDIGWPLRPKPDTDTRHADTNARFILACWRYWLWTGDTDFLRRQADRLRQAMRYQLKELRGEEGLIVTNSRMSRAAQGPEQ